jgi:predicted transcriptional regulator
MGSKLPQGELEQQVLDVLWDTGEPMTPAVLRQRLTESRPLAYTTVTTILARLRDKGLVDRRRVGRTFAYRPRVSREERMAERLTELLDTAGDRSVAFARFVSALPPEQRLELRRAIRAE